MNFTITQNVKRFLRLQNFKQKGNKMNTWIDETWNGLFLEPWCYDQQSHYYHQASDNMENMYDLTAVVEAWNLCMER